MEKSAKNTEFQKRRDGSELKSRVGVESVSESVTDSSESSCESFAEETKAVVSSSSPPLLGWPIRKASARKSSVHGGKGDEKKGAHLDDSKFSKMARKISEIDMMKERFAKLLLGEDMSGSGKGACTALSISNAITNLCATIFGQLWRLEPLPSEKKTMWRREMEWLLCVSDHIVELTPSMQTFPDGSKLEVMTCRPRTDLFMNLPALRKLDNMLVEILDSFKQTEFWYIDQGIVASDADNSATLCKTIQRHEDKWWLPVPRLPPDGLSENSRKQLNHTRECTNQILKAAMAINGITLADMDVPDSYLDALPKNGRSCLGDMIYRYITSDQFSSECLLDCLDLSSEHVTLDIANRVEASIYVWRRRSHSKPPINPSRSTTKSSWEMVKDLVIDGDKREVLAERAESLLLCLKQRFPGLTQTSLDISKIQCNKDVGKSILESYSRVLESLAYNIVARIDDLLYVDDLTKHPDKLSPVSSLSMIAQKKVSFPFSMPFSGTPYRTTFSTPSFSPAPLISPARGERSPFLSSKNSNNHSNDKANRRGFGVRRALTNYLGTDTKGKVCANPSDGSSSMPNHSGIELSGHRKESSVKQEGSKARHGCPRYTVS